MLPGILSQLGPDGLNQLKRIANNVVIGNKLINNVNEDDVVLNLIDNFEDASKAEVVAKPEEQPVPVVAPVIPAVAAPAAAPVAGLVAGPVAAPVEVKAADPKKEEVKVMEPVKQPEAPKIEEKPVEIAKAPVQAAAPASAAPVKVYFNY